MQKKKKKVMSGVREGEKREVICEIRFRGQTGFLKNRMLRIALKKKSLSEYHAAKRRKPPQSERREGE